MFEDQKVELLPARTTMKKWHNNSIWVRTGAAYASNYALVFAPGNKGDITVEQFANANTGLQVVGG
jgi:hypothetical protein